MYRGLSASVASLVLVASQQDSFYKKVPVELLPPRARHGALARSGRFADPATFATSTGYTLSVPLNYDEPEGPHFDVHYYVDNSQWDSASGPIFVSMGGEGGVSGAYCDSDAVTHKALCVSVEHRFYGKSLPSSSLGGVDTDTYRAGLKVEWNLRDTAAVIDDIQTKYVTGAPRTVMNFGGSYSGATCAWFRQLFPTKTAGCVSSSGVVDALLNFPEFDLQIGEAYASPDGDTCPSALHEAMSALERAFAAGRGDEMKTFFDAPKMIGTPMGDSDFWYGVADGAAMIDQYGGKAEMCTALAKLPSDADDDARIQNLKQLLDHHYGAGSVAGGFYDSECLKATGESYCASGVLGGLNDRSWRFQKCSELGYLQPAPALPALSMRSSHLTLAVLLEQCDYIFGANQSSAAKKNNAEFQGKFGGKLPRSGAFPDTSNIFFLDYSDDPWRRASVNTTSHESLPYCLTTCDGCGHCGSGVPRELSQCDDASGEFITQVLSGASAGSEADSATR